ncbi:MAG TPA: SIS domain-containing protein, partial [Phycisphaerae bacterium]|nr:SIS domain-containing protein [Phycisphaerae bacterium]
MIERIKRRLQEAADLYRQMAEQLAKPTAQAAEVLIAALREGHTIYVCGDGGSAAQAQHVAGELVGRFMAD